MLQMVSFWAHPTRMGEESQAIRNHKPLVFDHLFKSLLRRFPVETRHEPETEKGC
jgi:hypothetical protein